MRNRSFFRTLLVTTGLLVSLGLTACGKDEDASTEAATGAAVTTEASVAGKTESYFNFASVLIPDGMKLVEGKLAGHEDPDAFWIQLSDNEAHYYMVRIEDQETCVSSVKRSQLDNQGAKDVTVTAGDVTWTGVAYKYNDNMTDGFQIYGKLGEQYVLVSAGWHSVDEAATKAILSSIKLK